MAPPNVTCPQNIMRGTDAGVNYAWVNWTAPMPVGVENISYVQTDGPMSGSNFTLGVTHISYNVTNTDDGVQTLCEFNVTVWDDEAPMISNCPGSMVVVLDADKAYIMRNWTTPTAMDNVDGPLSYTSTSLNASWGPIVPFTGAVMPVVYTFTDAANNTAWCHFNLTILDLTPAKVSNCPGNLMAYNEPGKTTAVVTWPASNLTVTDNTLVIPVLNLTNPAVNLHNGSAFPLGVTNVIFVYTDPSHIFVNCTFTVTVLDADACTAAPNGNCSVNAICIDSAAPAPGTPDANGRRCICLGGYFGNGESCVELLATGTIRANITLNMPFDPSTALTLRQDFTSALINITGANVDQISVVSIEPTSTGLTLVVVSLRDPQEDGKGISANQLLQTITNAVSDSNSDLADYSPQSITSAQIASEDDNKKSGMSAHDKMAIILGVVAAGGLVIVGIIYLISKLKGTA